MDDEQSFAALLRSSTPAARPTWDAPTASGGMTASSGMSADPWANPFAASPDQPFVTPSIPRLPAVPDLPSPGFVSSSSPYDAFSSGVGSAGFGNTSRASVVNEVDDAAAAFGGMAISSSAARALVEDQKESPYVQQLESEGLAPSSAAAAEGYGGFDGNGDGYTPAVDPPSVIAAREQEALTAQQAFSHDEGAAVPIAPTFTSLEPTMEDDPFAQPFASPSQPFIVARPVSPPIPPFSIPSEPSPPRMTSSSSPQTNPTAAAALSAGTPSKKLPAGLIDDDLLAESDPMLSLKKAFVKSTPTASAAQEDGHAHAGKELEKGRPSPAPRPRAADKAKKTYVFNASPKKKALEVKKPTADVVKANAEEVKAATKPDGTEAKPTAVSEAQNTPVKQDVGESEDKGKEAAPENGTTGNAEVKVTADPNPADETDPRNGHVEGSDGASGAETSAEKAEAGEAAAGEAAGEIASEAAKPSVKGKHADAVKENIDEPVLQPVTSDGDEVSTAKRRSLRPAAIPLPPSNLTSPGLSRQASPTPNEPSNDESADPPATVVPSASSPTKIVTDASPVVRDDTAANVQTPYDRVAVSPLDGPVRQHSGFAFSAENTQDGQASAVAQAAAGGWDDSPLSAATQGRFSAKGWGAVDDLFGRKDDPWGSNDIGQQGWEQEAGPSTPAGQPDSVPAEAAEAAESQAYSQPEPMPETAPTPTRQSPVKPRRKTHPVFTVAVGDPTRVGDPVRGYTVYTIRTHTTSPHYRKSDLSALRRFSDFLWLVEALTSNNPGIVIPPVPDKHTFGRFQEQFIETRRLALERSLTKITSHPVLQLDPDLRLFLESDNFAVESRARRPVVDPAPEQRGLLSGWTGPRFVESDDWFVSRSAFLDSLEAQLRGLSKAIEVSSKARLDYAIALGESAESMTRLAESDLGSAMCAALARLADLGRTEKEAAEELAKGDVINLLNVADEYIRFIGTVRVAMQARTKGWFAWQSHVKEANRFKATREKMRAQGKLGDRAAQSLAEANELDRRAADAERDYETTSKVIKSEFARFERERVEEFKRALERWLDVQIMKQKEVIESWEEYHGVVLKMVQKAQGTRQPQSRE